MTTLEVVMIVGVSALILSIIVLAMPTIKEFFKIGVEEVVKNRDLQEKGNSLE